MEKGTLYVKLNKYKEVLNNTIEYRKSWHMSVKPMLLETLEELMKDSDIKYQIEERDNIENLESIVLDFGRSSSGISENLDNNGLKRTMIKSNGSLIYQQLFNGKIMVMILSPHIENYGNPKPPYQLEILRPDELKPPFIIRHIEALLKEVTEWEDYDDDQPQKANTIGFNPMNLSGEDAQ